MHHITSEAAVYHPHWQMQVCIEFLEECNNHRKHFSLASTMET
jgi:hypothetical protein